MLNIITEIKTLILNLFMFSNIYVIILYIALILYAYPILRSQFKIIDKIIYKIKNNQKSLIVGIGIASIIISNCGSIYIQNLDNGRSRLNIRKDIAKLSNNYSDKVILMPPINILLDDFSPFDYDAFNKWSELKILSSGWSTFSPRFYDNIRKVLHVDNGYEIIPKLLEGNNFILIANDSFVINLSTFISEHYPLEKDVIFVPIDNLSTSTIYKPVLVNKFNIDTCNDNI